MSLDKRHSDGGSASQVQSNFNRNNFEAVAGQTVFNLSFLLTMDSVVFLNYAPSPVPITDYSGFGTSTLTFITPLNLYDKVLIIG